jgi:ABC-2 type transport system permease protein
VKTVGIILRRELASYFATPLAYVFIVIFLFFTGLCTFYFGALYERGQADLEPMFNFLPWLFLFFVPAVSMRLWAEERKTGSIELLFTQPITVWQAVLAKYLAAWAFIGIALALTFPTWWTVAYLGNPDHGAIVAGYVGAFVMAGGFLAVGSCMSALTNNQVIAFVLAFVVCAVFVLAGFTAVTDWSRSLFSFIASWGIWGSGLSSGIESLGSALTNGIAGLSFLTHFENISRGVVNLRDVLYFALIITFFLLASTVLLDARKSK